MSNEMISVPRELLVNFIEYSEPVGDGDAAWYADKKALRALLAQPAPDAPECRCKRYGKDNPHWPCPVHSTVAEQHQGEPVYMVRTHGSCCWEEVGNGSLEDFQSMPEEYELRALYTRPGAQPAPAAVVLPEQKTTDNLTYAPESRSFVCGWNACIDEVVRLNPGAKSCRT